MIRNFLRLNCDPAWLPRRRSQLLERLLARAQVQELPDWRAAAFGALCQDRMPAVAPASLAARELATAHPSAAEYPWAWIATPVHLEPGLDNVRLSADGIVQLTSAEAGSLAADFERVWADAPLRLKAAGEALYLLSAAPWPAATHDPGTLLGEHIDEHLPEGSGAAPLKALMSEMEMWLFEHAVNRERARLGKAAVTGLWLWGGGARSSPPASDFAARGEDPLFSAFRSPGKEVRVVIASHAPGSTAWDAEENPWLEANIATLRRDAVLAISIQRRCFTVTAGWRWRWYRKTKAWWEYFE